MNITIVGAGKVGLSLAKILASEQHDITVIDNNEKVVESVSNLLDVICYVGNGASMPVLRSVGVENCDILIAVTGSDELNIFCCMTAGKLGAKNTIARVRNPEYASQLDEMKDELGLSMFINPERAASQEISRILRFPSASRVELFARGRVELVSLHLSEDSILGGMKLSDMPKKLGISLLVCAVERDGHAFVPKGDFVLAGGDEIYITGDTKAMGTAFKKIGIFTNPAKSIIIAGGGKISYYLANILSRQGKNVKIIEKNPDTARAFAEAVPSAVVLCGDALDQDLLNEEGIEKCDAYVALTGLDEGNILSSLYAIQQKVPKVIVKINNDSLAYTSKNIGIDTVISSKLVTTDEIIRYVRAVDASSNFENIRSLYKIVGGRVEVLEFAIDRSIEGLTDIPLSMLKLKKNVIIGCIVRRSEVITPSGSDMLLPGDTILVVSSGQRLNILGDILEERAQ